MKPTCTNCGSQRSDTQRCSLKYKCKLGWCSNKYPCQEIYAQCRDCHHRFQPPEETLAEISSAPVSKGRTRAKEVFFQFRAMQLARDRETNYVVCDAHDDHVQEAKTDTTATALDHTATVSAEEQHRSTRECCTKCGSDGLYKDRCSLQYKCKLNGCSNKYPCREMYVRCRKCLHSFPLSEDAGYSKEPAQVETHVVDKTCSHPAESVIVQRCSLQYKCKLNGCSNKYPCRQEYLQCRECFHSFPLSKENAVSRDERSVSAAKAQPAKPIEATSKAQQEQTAADAANNAAGRAPKPSIIPKGRTVDEDNGLRALLLNSVLRLMKTGLGRGPEIAEIAGAVGLHDDRPRKLIHHVKYGGGNTQQLEAAIHITAKLLSQ